MIFPYLPFPDRCLAAYVGEEFADYCLQSTPTPEFLLQLRHFDLSHLLHPTDFGNVVFVEVFGAVNAGSRIPKFLVWLQQQVSRENVLCR